MIKIIASLILGLSLTNLLGQEPQIEKSPEKVTSFIEELPIEKAPENVFVFVEEFPSYIGGDEAMWKFINENITYPEAERKNGLTGTVIVNFIIDSIGDIHSLRILREVKGAPGLSAEAIRLIKSMPKWKPGKMRGKEVSVYYNIPIKFKLN